MHCIRRLVTSIMIATECRWGSICKPRCCWQLSVCGLKLKLLRLLHRQACGTGSNDQIMVVFANVPTSI